MLGNHADQFMRTPMPTVVTTQERRAAQEEMPAPRPVARTSGFMPGLGNEHGFMPGLGNAGGFMPGLGMDMGGNTKWILLGGGALAAYFLFLRKR